MLVASNDGLIPKAHMKAHLDASWGKISPEEFQAITGSKWREDE